LCGIPLDAAFGRTIESRDRALPPPGSMGSGYLNIYVDWISIDQINNNNNNNFNGQNQVGNDFIQHIFNPQGQGLNKNNSWTP